MKEQNVATKMDQLWIRACKSKDPLIRIHSVYQRFYCNASVDDAVPFIAGILVDVCDRLCPISLSRIINALSPSGTVHGRYYEKVVVCLMNHIRYTEKEKLPFLIVPKHMRNVQ